MKGLGDLVVRNVLSDDLVEPLTGIRKDKFDGHILIGTSYYYRKGSGPVNEAVRYKFDDLLLTALDGDKRSFFLSPVSVRSTDSSTLASSGPWGENLNEDCNKIFYDNAVSQIKEMTTEALDETKKCERKDPKNLIPIVDHMINTCRSVFSENAKTKDFFTAARTFKNDTIKKIDQDKGCNYSGVKEEQVSGDSPPQLGSGDADAH